METTSTVGPATLGCPLATSGTSYCEVFEITQAKSGINTSVLGFDVQTPLSSRWSFNVTIGTSSGLGIAQFGNNSISGGTGWALCDPARCGSNTSSVGSLPANLSQGELFVVWLSGGPPVPNTTLQINADGRFSGGLTLPLN
ncbi:MAG: hypothetical protein L3K19_00230 [Thermoplasmata archaeon]|nr:hypothetical protein [Thermoplasmata archaeon]